MSTISWSVSPPRRLSLFPLVWYVHILRGSVIFAEPVYGVTARHATCRANQWISRYITPAWRGEL